MKEGSVKHYALAYTYRIGTYRLQSLCVREYTTLVRYHTEKSKLTAPTESRKQTLIFAAQPHKEITWFNITYCCWLRVNVELESPQTSWHLQTLSDVTVSLESAWQLKPLFWEKFPLNVILKAKVHCTNEKLQPWW